jgi:hypothetical protein
MIGKISYARSPNPLKKGASEVKVPLKKEDLGGSFSRQGIFSPQLPDQILFRHPLKLEPI